MTRRGCAAGRGRRETPAFTPYHVEAPPVRAGRQGGQPAGNLRRSRPSGRGTGFTLIEVVLGVLTLAIAAVAILGAYLGQVTLNEHARNLTFATHDANRVMERLRQDNSNCTRPAANVPAGFASWDAWLASTAATGGGGKSVQRNDTAGSALGTAERVEVSCNSQDGTTNCSTNAGDAAFAANSLANALQLDPIRITVAVCWRHRNRTLGECTWNGATLTASEAVSMPASSESTAIDSPAMLSTLVTCRG